MSVQIHPRLAVNTAEASVDAAVSGVGIARALTYQCAFALSTGSLVRVLREHEPTPFPVHLLHAGREPLPSKLRAFLDNASVSLRKRLNDMAS